MQTTEWFWQRYWHAFMSWMRIRRYLTPTEQSLNAEIETLRLLERRLRLEIEQLDRELLKERSKMTVRDMEVKLLVQVIERNQKRVESETNEASKRSALAAFDAQKIIKGEV